MSSENYNPEARLAELGLTLPKPSAPAANYVPYVISGNTLFIAGQISRIGDETIGSGLNLIAQMKAACGGDLTRVKRIVKLGGFVQSTPEATGPMIPQIVNGCSDIMVAVFGEAGRHARFAVSAPSLPLDVAVEIDAIVEIA